MIGKISQMANIRDNNICGVSLSVLYPSASHERPDFSPLVCIGQDLSVEGEFGCIDIVGIFLSPSGQVLFVLSSPLPISKINAFSNLVRSWSFYDLEAIASEFTYKAVGQSYRIIDLMAQHGNLTFSDGPRLLVSIEECMSHGKFILLCTSDPAPKSG